MDLELDVKHIGLASKLEVKCQSYPSLSHFHNGVCYIVDPGRKHTRNSLGDSTCNHLHQYNGIVAEHKEEIVRILERQGLLRVLSGLPTAI